MQHVESFLVLQFEVDVIVRYQHVDDLVAVARDGIVKRRVALYVLHKRRRHFRNGSDNKGCKPELSFRL